MTKEPSRIEMTSTVNELELFKFDLCTGDVLLIWNYPHVVASFLIKLITGCNCDHCAIVLGNPEDKMNVFEAYPPVVRRMPVYQYLSTLESWAGLKRKWRKRKDKWLKCEVWRSNDLTCTHLETMETEARRWLGVKYRMVFNYLFKTKASHCSEYVARILQAADLVRFTKEPSRVEPIEVRDAIQNAGWIHIGDLYPLSISSANRLANVSKRGCAKRTRSV
jgi:hypothetical protein